MQLGAGTAADVLVEKGTRIAGVSIGTAARDPTTAAGIGALNKARRIGFLRNDGSGRTRFGETVILTSFLGGEIIAISFASVVFKGCAGFCVSIEVISSNTGAAATNSDISGLRADVIFGGATKGLCLVDGAGPGGDGCAVMGAGTLAVAGASPGGAIGFLPNFASIGTRLNAAVIFAILLSGKVVRISVAAVEGVSLAGSSGTVIIPSSNRGPANCSRFCRERAGISLSGATSGKQ